MPNPVDTGLPNPASYTLNSDDTVTDNVTGLTWASPVYSANQTGGHIVQQEVCAAMRPAGSWRLPTRIELVSLIDFTVPSPGPTIDRSAFSNTPSASSATSTPYAGGAGAKWYVNFNSGGTGWGSTNAAGWTRCVRKTTATCDATMRYQARSGGLVFDDGTGLTWQRTVDASFYSWGDAKTHCAALGPSWRLPSLTELQTIVDETKLAPSIDGAIFPDTPSAPFWTSSMLANSTTEAWTVHFEGGYNGSAYPNNLTDTLKVRCVR